jgi:citrate lyase subunit beta / citryl-CoA lyase
MRWRSMLFVPGNRPDLAAKTTRNKPDVVVIDLEDAVPPADKVAARATARASALSLMESVAVCIRINAPSTEWFEDDISSLPDGLAGVVVPKWETDREFGFPVVAGLETVRGVVNARQILGVSVVACYFGAEDYIADLGGVRTTDNMEVLYARSAVGVAARLAGVPALDMITGDFGDSTRFTEEATFARSLGYTGKLCIHPNQVPLANAAFAPSPAEVDKATRLLAAFERANGATIAFEGQMIDDVIARQARALLASAMPE